MKQNVFNLLILSFLLIGMWSSVMVVKRDMDWMEAVANYNVPKFSVCENEFTSDNLDTNDADFIVNIVNSGETVHQTRPEYIS